MKSYFFETHAHTSEVSRCGKVDAKGLVKLYIKAGYSGVVITDHMNKDFEAKTAGLTWNEKVDFFMSGYEAAVIAAKDKLTVLLGFEIALAGSASDYLVYGVTKDFLLEHENICDMGIEKFSKIIRENNLLIFQAHPFRNNMTITLPKLLDGIEVYNGNERHDSRNDIAESWANKFNLKKISGSDFHQIEDVAKGGIITPYEITSNEMLLKTLTKTYELKKEK